MKKSIRAFLGVLILGGATAGLVFAFLEMRMEREQEQEREKPVAAPTHASRTPQGDSALTLDAAMQRRIGLTIAPLKSAEHRPASQGFARVLDATSLSQLLNELAQARTNLAATEKELARVKMLSAQTILSDSVLLAAETAAGHDRLVTQAAEDKLALAFGREFAEQADLPGLARALATLDAALVRVDFPPGRRVPSPPKSVSLFAPANEADIFTAEFVGPATSIDPEFQGQALFYLSRPSERRLAPGANLTAILEWPDAPSAGVLVPRAAVVRSNGRGWAFVQSGADTFVRREVKLTIPTSDGWFVASGFEANDKVVVEGAQVLLSEMGKNAIRMME